MGFEGFSNKINNFKNVPTGEGYSGYGWLSDKNIIPKITKPYTESVFTEKDPVVIDGNINMFNSQGKTGDCYLLGTVNAAAKTDKGKEVIKERVFRDELSGMVGVKIGDKGKVYYFTDDEIRNAQTKLDFSGLYTEDNKYIFGGKIKESGRLSRGDDDLVAIELAYEQTRIEKMLELIDSAGGEEKYNAFIAQMKEAQETGKPFIIETSLLGYNKEFIALFNQNIRNGVIIEDPKDPLSGGQSSEFAKTFFGKNISIQKTVNIKPMVFGASGVAFKDVDNKDKISEHTPGEAQQQKIDNITESQKKQIQEEIDSILKQGMEQAQTIQLNRELSNIGIEDQVSYENIKSINDYGNPKKDAMVVSFKEDKGEMFKKHAFSIKDEDEQFVTLINPWYAAYEVKIPRKDFYENIYEITVINFDKDKKEKAQKSSNDEMIVEEKIKPNKLKSF